GAVLWVAFGRYFFSDETIAAVGVLPGLVILGVQLALCHPCFRAQVRDRPINLAILAILTGFAALVGAVGGDLTAAVVGALAGAGAGFCVAIAAFGVTGLAVLRGTIAMFLVLTGAIALAGMLILATLGAGVLAVAGAVTGAEGVTVGLLLALVGLVVFLGLGSLGAWQSQRRDRLTPAWQGLLALAAWGGTQFRHSDLTEANYAQAQLGACNFDRATTTRTSWRGVPDLNRAYPNAALAANWPWLEVLTQGRGRGRDLREASLAGVNLREANLRGANLAGVDLRGSTLAGANLTEANLSGALCQGTDFAGASLTGAKVGQWLVDGATGWEAVVCESVFLDAAGTDRCPANPRQIFREGDFQRYFAPNPGNLQLLLRQGIHLQALGLALEVLQAEFGIRPGAIVAIEHRNPDVLLRLQIPGTVLEKTPIAQVARCFHQAYDRALKPTPAPSTVFPTTAPTPMGAFLGHLLAPSDATTLVPEPTLADRLYSFQKFLKTQPVTPGIDRALKYLQILMQWANLAADLPADPNPDSPPDPHLDPNPAAAQLGDVALADRRERAELALDALQGLAVLTGEEWEEVVADLRRSLE
ncbi:MAG: pentapeptide repeat-containing protein, partial [Prochlorothrix sp.]